MSQPTPPPDDEIDPLLDDPDVQAWFEDHMTVVAAGALTDSAFLYVTAIASAFVVGLVGYVARIRPEIDGDDRTILGLLADMLYTFGFALWTAAVVGWCWSQIDPGGQASAGQAARSRTIRRGQTTRQAATEWTARGSCSASGSSTST